MICSSPCLRTRSAFAPHPGGTVILAAGRWTLSWRAALPKRRNIVFTHCLPGLFPPGLEGRNRLSLAAMREATAGTPDQLWVIGGGSIYAATLPMRTGLRDPGGRRRGGRGLLLSHLDKLPGWTVEPSASR